jgi:hypothetical protein
MEPQRDYSEQADTFPANIHCPALQRKASTSARKTSQAPFTALPPLPAPPQFEAARTSSPWRHRDGVAYPGMADNCLAPRARDNAPMAHRCKGVLPWCRTSFAPTSHCAYLCGGSACFFIPGRVIASDPRIQLHSARPDALARSIPPSTAVPIRADRCGPAAPAGPCERRQAGAPPGCLVAARTPLHRRCHGPIHQTHIECQPRRSHRLRDLTHVLSWATFWINAMGFAQNYRVYG